MLHLRVSWNGEQAPSDRGPLMRMCAEMALPAVENLDLEAECRRLRSDLARRDFHLYAIYQVGKDLGAVLDLDEIVGILADVMAEVLTVRLACVLMKEEDGGCWGARSVHLPMRDAQPPHFCFQETEHVSEWLAGLEWETRAVEDFEDPAFQAAFPGAAKQLQAAGAGLVAPLLHKRRLLGLLVLGAKMGSEGFSRADHDILSVLAPLASHSLSNARLYQQSIVDGLTGVHVVRYFRQRVREELKRGLRYSYPVGLLIMDVDGFKQVNDVQGHLVGDRLLEEIASCVHGSCRVGVDLVGRYGGDEFVVMLPQTPLPGSLVVAERIRKLVAGCRFTGQGLQVTVSCGVAVFPEHGRTEQDLLACADGQLLRAKREGRNRVCVRREDASEGVAEGPRERLEQA